MEREKQKLKFRIISKHKKLFKFHQLNEKEKKDEPIIVNNTEIDTNLLEFSSDDESELSESPPMPNFPPPPPPFEIESDTSLDPPNRPSLIRSKSSLMVISTANSETPKIFTDIVDHYRKNIESSPTRPVSSASSEESKNIQNIDELAETLKKELQLFEVIKSGKSTNQQIYYDSSDWSDLD